MRAAAGPGIRTYLTGSSLDALASGQNRRRLVLNGVFFILGFTLVFVVMGMGASAIGRLLTEHMGLVRRIGGVIVIVFGLYLTGLLQLMVLDQERRLQAPVKAPGPVNSLLLGATFAVGWTPCIGPVLASVRCWRAPRPRPRRARAASDLRRGNGAAVPAADAFAAGRSRGCASACLTPAAFRWPAAC